jgi:hypothetical protein
MQDDRIHRRRRPRGDRATRRRLWQLREGLTVFLREGTARGRGRPAMHANERGRMMRPLSAACASRPSLYAASSSTTASPSPFSSLSSPSSTPAGGVAAATRWLACETTGRLATTGPIDEPNVHADKERERPKREWEESHGGNRPLSLAVWNAHLRGGAALRLLDDTLVFLNVSRGAGRASRTLSLARVRSRESLPRQRDDQSGRGRSRGRLHYRVGRRPRPGSRSCMVGKTPGSSAYDESRRGWRLVALGGWSRV